METKWQPRKNKTRQDLQPAGVRDRVHEWDRRRAWAIANKPRNSSDWLAYRSK